MKWCLGHLALLKGEPIDLGHLIVESIKYMTNVVQRVCGYFCIINELCRRAGVPVYFKDEMISLKAPINAYVIRRLQNMCQGEVAQNDQEGDQACNDGGFYQPQV